MRLSDKPTVEAALRPALAAQLRELGFNPTDGQPFQLVARLQETRVENPRNKLSLFFGPPPAQNGQAEFDTEVTLTLQLRDAATGDLYWQRESKEAGWLSVQGETSEQSMRDAAFRRSVENLRWMRLPWRLFKITPGVLPVATQLE